MNFHKLTLACLCMLLTASAFSQRGQASITSTEGWSITVNMEYRGMRITSAKKNCADGFNYQLDVDYTYTFSDGVSRNMHWLGTNGACFSEGGNMTIEQNTTQSGTVASPTQWSDMKSPCKDVDYASFACLPEYVIFQGPGIEWELVELVPVSESPGNLPIELTDFRAGRVGSRVQLNWKTASELTNDHFLVERSADAVQWQPIGKLDGAGTSQRMHSYEYLDENPLAGMGYYRLTQVDTDGTSTASGIVTVATSASPEQRTSLTVYPNPVSDRLTVQSEHPIAVFDLHGRRFDREITDLGNGAYTLSVADLPVGVYIVRSGKAVSRFIHR